METNAVTETHPMRSMLESARLPLRVQHILERVLALASDELAMRLERMLVDFEERLFRHAEQARNPTQQSMHFETLRSVRVNRSDLVPRFLHELERTLAAIREPIVTQDEAPELVTSFAHLRLVDDDEVTEASALRAMAVRHEARSSLPLLLLGQRFGVLAGSPAFEAQTLPVGPQELSRILAEASTVLQIRQDARLELFQSFETHVLGNYGHLVDALNGLLAREGVLPDLAYVPLRTRRINPKAAAASAERAPAGQRVASAAPTGVPHTGWMGEVTGASEQDDVTFQLLQELLADRKGLIGKLRTEPQSQTGPFMSAEELQQVLAARQAQAASAPPGQPSKPSKSGLAALRQALLSHGRRVHGESAALSQADTDVIELLALLFTEMARDMRQESTGSSLLERLQIPLLRVALRDHAFFARTQHPARQLLNAVAESGASWLAEDERDPVLEGHLQKAVDHVVKHYAGDNSVFVAANRPLQEHLHSMARKAEVAERRNVEAARGKERLEVSKSRAREVLDGLIGERTLPRFIRSLFDQAWADVLTLTLLRSSEDSDAWRVALEDTRALVVASFDGRPAPSEIQQRVHDGLLLVGYHEDDAQLIARKLCGIDTPDSDDVGSRTELAMKLKARARLGEQAVPERAPPLPRNEAEEACYEKLCTLPFGTWFEFVTNQQGDVVRRRLAWHSSITGHVLFVNQRGQRVDEQTLDSLARAMARGQARIVTTTVGRLIDRAWHATLAALRRFARPTSDNGEAQ